MLHLEQEIDEDDSMIKVGRRGGGQLPSSVSLDFEAMFAAQQPEGV